MVTKYIFKKGRTVLGGVEVCKECLEDKIVKVEDLDKEKIKCLIHSTGEIIEKPAREVKYLAILDYYEMPDI